MNFEIAFFETKDGTGKSCIFQLLEFVSSDIEIASLWCQKLMMDREVCRTQFPQLRFEKMLTFEISDFLF